jgi:hypothetical protein
MNRPCQLAIALMILGAMSSGRLLGQSAGLVVDVHGKCHLRRASDATQKDHLIQSKDVLYVEDQLRCDPGGSVTVQLGYLKKTLGPSSQEYAVPLAPPAPPTADQKLLAAAFQDFGTRGGRNRGAGAGIYSPPSNGRALPESLLVHWQPWADAKQVAIRIQSQTHGEIFGQNGIENTGSFASDSLHAALRAQQQSDPNGILVLLIYPAGSTVEHDRVQFKLLPPPDEDSLKHDLEAADKQESPLVRRIARGYAFSSRKLWTEAAIEYEAAVKESPDNAVVLERAIRAENETGNTLQQAAFDRQLQKLEVDKGK